MTKDGSQPGHGLSALVDRGRIQLARSPDTKSFAELIERHQSAVFGVALAITSDPDMASDVSQDTFVSAWRGISNLRDPDRIGAWLNGIARNLANNANRKLAREQQVRNRTKSQITVDECTLEQREDARRIFAILRELPEKYRVPLVLYYQEDRSVADVAELLELSPSAVKKRLERGRDLIKESALGELRTTLGATRVRTGLSVAVLALLGDHGSAAASSSAGQATANGVTGREPMAKYGFLALAVCTLVGFGLFYAFSPEQSDEDRTHPRRQVAEASSIDSAKSGRGGQAGSNEAVEAVEIELESALDSAFPAVHLRVLDLLGGPIAGARFHDGVRNLIVGETDVNGLLRVPIPTSLTGVFHQVEVHAQGYAKKDVSLAGYGDYEVRMVPESTLSGRVLSSEGAVLPGMRVTAFARAAPGLSESIQNAVTEPDGQFHLSGLAPGSHRLLASGEGWTLGEQRTVELGMHATEQVELVMTRGVSVSGYLDTHGSPFSEGLVVEARSEERPNSTAPVGPDGRFRFSALADGEYELVVRQISIAGRRKVQVDGSAIEGVVLDVGRLHSQRIIAREADGSPVVGVDITARQQINDLVQLHRCTTDNKGGCEIGNLLEGPLSRVRPSMLPRDAARSVSIPSEDVLEFVFPESGGISGSAFAHSGTPLAYKVVTLTAPGARKPRSTVVTDAQGRYSFSRLPEGSYVLRVFPTSDFIDPMVGSVESCGEQSIVVTKGVQKTLDIRTDLKLTSIVGRVLDRSGAIVPGALLTFAVDHERHNTFDSRYSEIAVADEAGRFQLNDIPVGPSFRVLAQDAAGLEGMVLGVFAGDTVTVTLQTVAE